MRLSSCNLFIYSLQILAASNLVSKVDAFAEDHDPLPYNHDQIKGIQVGDAYAVRISSTYDESDIKPVTSEDGKTDTYVLKYANASYISVHFSQFDLPSSCLLNISDGNHDQLSTLKGQGKLNLGTFWGHHVTGNTMKLSLSCDEEEDKELALFEIDQFAAGFPVSYQPDVRPYERHLRSRDDSTPSFLKSIDEQRKLSICGIDDKRNAICYKDSEPTIYNKAKAVARLLINGRSACTGWLVSSESLLFTNEHCIDSLSDVQNTDFEFMGEESNCAIGSSDGSWMSSRNRDGIYDGTALLSVSATWDYALIQLSGNPANIYGFLELDNRKASVNEQIYIPQHPGGRPKEIGVFDSNHNGNCRVMRYSRGCSPEDMRYSCDTEGGSSGSPVLSRTNNKVIALHHCGGGCNGNLGAPIYRFYNEIQGLIGVPVVTPTSKPSSSPTLKPSIKPPSPAPAPLISYNFPTDNTNQFVHGICAMGASHVQATATDPNLTYTSISEFQNGVKMWGDRNYVTSNVSGNEMCQGGIYLQPSRHKSIARGTEIMFEANPAIGAGSVTVCAFVISSDGRTGLWDQTLPNAGFTISGDEFLWSNGRIGGEMKSYCKTLVD